MANVVFFSFTESDRNTVLTIKGRAVNPNYSNLNFRVRDLLKRWDTNNVSVIRQAISKKMKGTSRTIVLVGNLTYSSRWVREEVEMTLENNKSVYAIKLKNSIGLIPPVLFENNIKVHGWSESALQGLAIR
ncbi:TIR domain-containing protein [Fodinibius sediminis]|uniref:MTH538 TIR-like domain n=1 Tax=Fodinibius sediminis TaxID=1214077 RepID=A0A521AUI9_9BACT|nr:TIR domain-containing protein [Fodinibius sediminis]SMO38477.1 MTH538 TIR-like domain [Fodinibius sediminis]